MNRKKLRFLAYAGILLTLFLSVWYLWKTYHEGHPKWIFLVLAAGITVLLSQRSSGYRNE